MQLYIIKIIRTVTDVCHDNVSVFKNFCILQSSITAIPSEIGLPEDSLSNLCKVTSGATARVLCRGATRNRGHKTKL